MELNLDSGANLFAMTELGSKHPSPASACVHGKVRLLPRLGLHPRLVWSCWDARRGEDLRLSSGRTAAQLTTPPQQPAGTRPCSHCVQNNTHIRQRVDSW